MASAELRQSSRNSRKRGRQTQGAEDALAQFAYLAANAQKIIVFTGSGISANSGMSMFSTRNGLYERARKRFKITDGIKLFSYPFYKQRKADVQAFFAEIYTEAQASRASPGHHALSQLNALGRLQRHYTLNIDGLAEIVGLDTWHHEDNPNGSTVEMHGNIRDMVCPECHATEPLTRSSVNTMKQSRPVMCTRCPNGEMRFKVMLYDDEQGDCITPEDVFEQLEEDLGKADMVAWVGISFEQSASTEYFRKVRHLLSSIGRSQEVRQVIVNPSDEALFNVLSSLANRDNVEVLEVLARSDEALPMVMDRLHASNPEEAAKAVELASAAAAAAVERRTLQLRRSRSPPAHPEPKLPPLWLSGGAAAKQEQQQQQEMEADHQVPKPRQQQEQQEMEANHQVPKPQQQQQQQHGVAAHRMPAAVGSDAGGLLDSTVLAATTALWGPVTNGAAQEIAMPLFQHPSTQQSHAHMAVPQQQHLQEALAALAPSADAGPGSAALAAAMAACTRLQSCSQSAQNSSEAAKTSSQDAKISSQIGPTQAPIAAKANAAGIVSNSIAKPAVSTPLQPTPWNAQSVAPLNAAHASGPSIASKHMLGGTAPSTAPNNASTALSLLIQALGPQVAAGLAAAQGSFA